MKKYLGIRIPKEVYDSKSSNISKILDVQYLDDEPYISIVVKELDHFRFNNQEIESEDEENVGLIQKVEREDIQTFYQEIVPEIFKIWNEYNAEKLKELEKLKLRDDEIETYFVEHGLAFENHVDCVIFFK